MPKEGIGRWSPGEAWKLDTLDNLGTMGDNGGTVGNSREQWGGTTMVEVWGGKGDGGQLLAGS